MFKMFVVRFMVRVLFLQTCSIINFMAFNVPVIFRAYIPNLLTAVSIKLTVPCISENFFFRSGRAFLFSENDKNKTEIKFLFKRLLLWLDSSALRSCKFFAGILQRYICRSFKSTIIVAMFDSAYYLKCTYNI
jgi:hypothetical protein